jgi:hypothetical protein
MAQSSFPFEGIDTTETQFSQMFRHLQDGVNGTYGGTELTVGAGTGLAVDVEAGQAMVRGHYYVSTAVESLALATADPTNPRLDIVVLRLDPVANSIVLAVKSGTPAGSPVAPALVQTDAGIYEMALATVLVPATAGVPSTITDLREFMGTRISMWTDDTRPTTAVPHVGYNVTQETFEGYDVIAEEWGPIGGGGGGVTISATAPADPAAGDLWWDSDDGKLFVYYTDGDSSQWVDAAGPSVAVQSTAPTGYEGQLWLDDTDGSMYVYYTDPGGGASSWIGAVSRSGGILQVVSTTKTDVFTTTSASYVDVTGFTASITPSSTSSKILVRVNAAFTNEGGTAKLRLLRDATPIGNHDSQDYFVRSNPSANATTTNFTRIEGGGFLEILDTPATASSVTYKIQTLAESDTTNINDTRTSGYYSVSSITLIEVAG